jgi:hypothetical protein
MQIVTNTTGVTAIQNVKIAMPTRWLEVKITHATSMTAAEKTAVEIEVEAHSKEKGTRTVIEKTTLETLLEISANHGEGYYVDQDALFAGQLLIARDGSLGLSNDEYLTVNITGLIAGMTTNVWAADDEAGDTHRINYKRLSVNEGRESRFDISGAYGLAVRLDKVTSITIEGKRAIKYTVGELESMARRNDLVKVNQSTITYGSSKFLVIDVTDAHHVQIVPSVDTLIHHYALQEVAL